MGIASWRVSENGGKAGWVRREWSGRVLMVQRTGWNEPGAWIRSQFDRQGSSGRWNRRPAAVHRPRDSGFSLAQGQRGGHIFQPAAVSAADRNALTPTPSQGKAGALEHPPGPTCRRGPVKARGCGVSTARGRIVLSYLARPPFFAVRVGRRRRMTRRTTFCPPKLPVRGFET